MALTGMVSVRIDLTEIDPPSKWATSCAGCQPRKKKVPGSVLASRYLVALVQVSTWREGTFESIHSKVLHEYEHTFYYESKRHIGGEGRVHEIGIPPTPAGVERTDLHDGEDAAAVDA